MKTGKYQLLTVPEAAEYLRLKEATIYHYVHHNRIGYYKQGSRLCFDISDLDDYLEAKYVPVLEARKAS